MAGREARVISTSNSADLQTCKSPHQHFSRVLSPKPQCLRVCALLRSTHASCDMTAMCSTLHWLLQKLASVFMYMSQSVAS
jgi:hypothetical protein